MQRNKIVVKFREGAVLKGQTGDFYPNKALFHVETTEGEIHELSMEDLKAIFFVKDLAGDKDHRKKYDDMITAAGRKIKVRFKDGEEITGYTLGYSPERPGFLVTPADLNGNNERIYVVKSATEKIEFVK